MATLRLIVVVPLLFDVVVVVVVLRSLEAGASFGSVVLPTRFSVLIDGVAVLLRCCVFLDLPFGKNMERNND